MADRPERMLGRALAPEVKPYRPPDLTPPGHRRHGEPKAENPKPWMALRPGETERQWQHRVNHSCYRCGHFEEDSEALDLHESEHG